MTTFPTTVAYIHEVLLPALGEWSPALDLDLVADRVTDWSFHTDMTGLILPASGRRVLIRPEWTGVFTESLRTGRTTVGKYDADTRSRARRTLDLVERSGGSLGANGAQGFMDDLEDAVQSAMDAVPPRRVWPTRIYSVDMLGPYGEVESVNMPIGYRPVEQRHHPRHAGAVEISRQRR